MGKPADVTKLGSSRLRSVLDLHSKNQTFALVKNMDATNREKAWVYQSTGLCKYAFFA
jgi:hypothetical protein